MHCPILGLMAQRPQMLALIDVPGRLSQTPVDEPLVGLSSPESVIKSRIMDRHFIGQQIYPRLSTFDLP